jgi:hypothetical protein
VVGPTPGRLCGPDANVIIPMTLMMLTATKMSAIVCLFLWEDWGCLRIWFSMG